MPAQIELSTTLPHSSDEMGEHSQGQATDRHSDEAHSTHNLERSQQDLEAPDSTDVDSAVPDGGYGWVVVTRCAVLTFWFNGIMASWGVIQAVLLRSDLRTTSTSTVSFIGTLGLAIVVSLGLFGVRLIHSFGARTTALIGVVLLASAEILASFTVSNVGGLFGTAGVLFGLGACLCYALSNIVPTIRPGEIWRRRWGGVGAAVLSISIDAINDRVGIQWTFRILGMCMLATCGPAAWLLRERVSIGRAPFVDLSLFRYLPFVAVFLAGATGTFALFVPPYFLPLVVQTIGLSSSIGAWLVAGFNACTAVGRLLAGYGSDIIGPVNMLLCAMVLNAASMLAIWPFSSSLGPLITFVMLNGLANGAFFTVYPVVVTSTASGIGNDQASKGAIAMSMAITGWTVRRSSSNSFLQKPVLRGLPRKPKQSGHALWVGNLPPATHIIDLKDHFSRYATDDIESVFLIVKSNCAFVNYKSETSCAGAMSRFHDSRFQGVRLICKLRHGSLSTNATASVPKPPFDHQGDGEVSPVVEDGTLTDGEAKVSSHSAAEVTEKVKEKFFVVKSLTVDDLERSVHSKVWATQAHNESALNQAFDAAENVYLIFSANKSGEYFGYARMETTIDGNSVADVEYQPSPEVLVPTPTDLPLMIPTQATSTAPKGRIVEDSARGTIFWEAESEKKIPEEQVVRDERADLSGESDDSANISPGTPQAFGKPFKIKWISTDRLPFYRTKGLRNPWNADREVKIARDGTEIEPSIGRRLVSMFHCPRMLIRSSNAIRQQQSPQPRRGISPYVNPHVSAPGGVYGWTY
ncbi:hypothetical protein LTR84_011304 [Exophiala bonariae]|uniref:YTH domain-containing protein n=1 Tax=Exophiala bonariae TaxID=1690606 RepID=A0AAV9MSE6_9EURO|nr:hypothetical protein LTR84_011304 [Exophiala bonariae]